MTKKVTVVSFPGTNCDHDVEHVAANLFGCPVKTVWHRDLSLEDADVVFLPGGFAYGDYLRTGALAALSPIMSAVKEFAANGGTVIGICNGFQILCEAQILPGALLPNSHGTFCSRWLTMEVAGASVATQGLAPGTHISCPVAHGEGNYFAEEQVLNELQANDQITFRYTSGDNPNGSARDIAGICNKARNVVGFMPHPERACELLLGSDSGRQIFANLLG